MNKISIGTGLFIALIIGAGIFLNSKGPSLIKNGIETNGSSQLGAKVSLGDISFDILQGQASLKEFTIGQPAGFGEGESFKVKEFSIDLEPLSLFQDHIKIETILIDKASLNLIMTGKESNFGKLQSNLAGEMASGSDTESDVKLSIKQLNLNQTHLRIQSDKYGNKEITLADIKLENIGISEGGIAPNQAVSLTLDALKPQIAKALIELGIKDKLNEEINKQLDGKLKDLPAPLADKLKSGLGGLFKKKDTTDKDGTD